jgi:tripartite-type tricarboxylate transporter receptor subunit TctC
MNSIRILAAWFAATLSLNAIAQEFPSRVVNMVVPFTPGTGADIIARTLGPRLAERWKVGVVTDNRSGASGNIAAEHVARANPDGHTLLFTATIFTSNRAVNTKLPFDPITHFTPIVLIATSPVGFFVHPQFAANTLRDLVTEVKKQPAKFHYASTGNGGPQHLAMELFKLEAGIDLVHIPYKNNGTAVADLVGGHVQAMVIPTHTAAPFVRNGKLKLLAVMSEKRARAFPDTPTVAEQGIANVALDTWYGVFAPAATPAAVVARLNTDLNTLLAERDISESLAKQGMTIAGGPPERLSQLVTSELARWSRVVKAAGIKAD